MYILTALPDSPHTLSQEDLEPFYGYIKHCRIRFEARVMKLFRNLEIDLRSDGTLQACTITKC
jgi:hypothetical protein